MARVKTKGFQPFKGDPNCIHNTINGCKEGYIFCARQAGKECPGYKTEEDIKNAATKR